MVCLSYFQNYALLDSKDVSELKHISIKVIFHILSYFLCQLANSIYKYTVYTHTHTYIYIQLLLFSYIMLVLSFPFYPSFCLDFLNKQTNKYTHTHLMMCRSVSLLNKHNAGMTRCIHYYN